MDEASVEVSEQGEQGGSCGKRKPDKGESGRDGARGVILEPANPAPEDQDRNNHNYGDGEGQKKRGKHADLVKPRRDYLPRGREIPTD